MRGIGRGLTGGGELRRPAERRKEEAVVMGELGFLGEGEGCV
jgi:hypothetical protein